MGAFEFFFSLYGLVLGMSLAVVATGMATAIQHRKHLRIGWLTPMLAAFLGLDIASFWQQAWDSFGDMRVSYGVLVAGMVIAGVYFIAASLVFPHEIKDGDSLDDHFWANKRIVLLLLAAANILAVLGVAPSVLAKPHGPQLLGAYGVTLALYLVLIVPAALTRRRWLFTALVGLHIAIYLAIALFSFHPGTALPG